MRPAMYSCWLRSTVASGESLPSFDAKPTSTSSAFRSPASLRSFCTLAHTSRAIASSSIAPVGFVCSTRIPAPSAIKSTSRSPVGPAYSSDTLMSSPENSCPPMVIEPDVMKAASCSWVSCFTWSWMAL